LENRERALICPNCGASLEYSPGARALKCLYCRTVTQIEPEADAAGATDETDKLAPTAPEEELIVPLALTKDQLLQAIYSMLSKGKYTPDDLLERAAFRTIEQFYVPAYVFVTGRHADVGRPSTSGEDVVTLGAISYVGSRLRQSKLPVIAKLVEGCRGIVGAKAYEAAYTDGIDMEAFPTLGSQVDATAGKSVNAHRETASPGRQRCKLYVPTCHVVYEYEGRFYEAWVDGSSAENVVADAVPVDRKRKRAAWYAFLPTLLVLPTMLVAAALAGPNLKLDSALPALAVIAAPIFGFLRRRSILKYSQRLRDALLAQRRLSSARASGFPGARRSTAAQASQIPTRPLLARQGFVLPLACMATILATSQGWQSAESAESAASITASDVAKEQAVAAAQASMPIETGDLSIDRVLQMAASANWSGVDQSMQILLRSGAAPPAEDRDEATARREYAAGKAALQRKDYYAAGDAFDRAVKADPINAEYLRNLGHIRGLVGQQAGAVAAYLSALSQAPRDTDAWVGLATNLAETGKPYAARLALLVALHVSTNREQTLELLRRQSTEGRSVGVRTVSGAVYEMAKGTPAT